MQIPPIKKLQKLKNYELKTTNKVKLTPSVTIQSELVRNHFSDIANVPGQQRASVHNSKQSEPLMDENERQFLPLR